jgi:hypothetical protein
MGAALTARTTAARAVAERKKRAICLFGRLPVHVDVCEWWWWWWVGSVLSANQSKEEK